LFDGAGDLVLGNVLGEFDVVYVCLGQSDLREKLMDQYYRTLRKGYLCL
jgi:hypothetical protein